MTFLPSVRWVGDQSAPDLAFVLHGALGSSQNLSRFARELAQHAPALRYALVDIRGHGDSGAPPPPHSLGAAADDLAALATHLGRVPRVVIGHSLGGKLGLEYARRHPGAEQVWMLDANPGAQPAVASVSGSHPVRDVYAALREAGVAFASRAQAVEALVQHGLSSPIAEWLATSLRRSGDDYVWAYDFACLDELLDDYFALDLWDYLEAQRARPEVHLVIAERGGRWIPGMRERAETAAERGRLVAHLLPDAGHWVHVDNPRGLLEQMTPHLRALGGSG